MFFKINNDSEAYNLTGNIIELMNKYKLVKKKYYTSESVCESPYLTDSGTNLILICDYNQYTNLYIPAEFAT